jgi:hypothetical protein
MRTTTLITTNIAAAADLIAGIPDTIKSNIQSMTIKKIELDFMLHFTYYVHPFFISTSFRYSFFSEPEPEHCGSPLIPASPVYFHAVP